MILLLTHRDDPVVGRVLSHLEARGASVLRLDDADVPCRASLSVAASTDGGFGGALRVDGRRIDLSEIRVAWDHRPGAPTPPPELTRISALEFARNEARRLVDDLWHTLPISWFPARKADVLRAQHKVSQLRLAARLGFPLPPTLVTADPGAARAFFREHDGRIVSKTFWMAVVPCEADSTAGFACFTQVMSGRSVVELNGLRACPMILQAYVPKASELRVTVVGERVLACEIASQSSHRARLDVRQGDLGRVRYRAVELPPEVEARCVGLLRALGTHFGTIDLIRDRDGEYVFLEINPSGQWRWIEDLSGLPIAATIADWLFTVDREGGLHVQ